MRVVFMGTPEIAVPALRAIANHHELAGVFCQPDKPVGRKQVLSAPPVKRAAQELSVPVCQPAKLRDGTALTSLMELRPDVIVVMAYGRILPVEILSLPKYGCLNIHASILPKYRGAAPIQRALENGETQTGITVMRMEQGLDTGDMLPPRVIDIKDADDADSLSERLAALAAAEIITALSRVKKGTALFKKQDDAKATWAPIITKNDGLFTFSDYAREIVNKTRAFCSWPCARTELFGSAVKLNRAALCDKTGKIGRILALSPLTVAAKNGSVELIEVTPQGAKRMSGTAFAAGRRLCVGDNLCRDI